MLDIHAVDSTTLYRLHAAGQIMVSHDRGATWTAQGNIPAATAITFVSHDTGWALQNKQLRQTSDGGVTWHDVGLGYPVQSLAALPNGTVWVITDEPRSMDTINYLPRHRLLHSTDAGRTWREVHFTEYGFLLPNNEADWSGWIQFADAQHGWIGTSLSSSATLVYTNDGGTAWFGMR